MPSCGPENDNVVARLHDHRFPARHRLAVEPRAQVRAGQGDRRRRDESEARADQRHLQAGRLVAVADQPVRRAEREEVQRARGGHAVPLVAEPPEILDGGQHAAVDHLDRLHDVIPRTVNDQLPARMACSIAAYSSGGDRDEADVVAGLDDDRRHARGIEQRDGRATDQLPAAGTLDRVDAGLLLGDADRAGRDCRPRRLQPGRRDAFRHPAEVGEARTEAHHVDEVVSSRSEWRSTSSSARWLCSATNARSGPNAPP